MPVTRWSALVAGLLLVACVAGAGQAAPAASPPAPAEAVDVTRYGAKGDGKTDDTEAIRRAFEAARRTRVGNRAGEKGMYYSTQAPVVFPAGAYLISDSIQADVESVLGIGDPSLRQTQADKDVLVWQNAWQGKVSGLTFVGGRTHLNLGNPNTDKGRFAIEDCRFYHSSGPAIVFRDGSASTFLSVRDCVIADCMQALISHTDWTTVRDTWISSHRQMDHKAVIENYGVMTLDNMLGVPRSTGVDQRWIDNHGQLHAVGCRFGAEGGGFTPVVNFAKFDPQASGNSILLDNCWLYAQSNFKRQCAVYCEELPNMIEIRNSILGGIPGIKVDKKIDLLTYFAGARPGMLRYSLTRCVGEFSEDLPRLLQHPVIEGAAAVDQLSEQATAGALAKAVAQVGARSWPAGEPMRFKDHVEKQNPGDFVALNFQTAAWDLSDYMDGTRQPNQQYMAVAPAGDDIVLMRRQAGKWPHVLIKDIRVDLDRYPYLTWKLRDAVEGAPNRHAVRIIDLESERMVGVAPKVEHGTAYQAYNVKELLGASGVRQLQVRFYYLGSKYIGATPEKAGYFETAGPGQYMILDYIRFETP